MIYHSNWTRRVEVELATNYSYPMSMPDMGNGGSCLGAAKSATFGEKISLKLAHAFYFGLFSSSEMSLRHNLVRLDLEVCQLQYVILTNNTSGITANLASLKTAPQ